MSLSFRALAHCMPILALTGCVTAPDALQLPLQSAWYEGRAVHYVTTDVSDAEMAREKGANFVPRLRELLPQASSADLRQGSPLERVYSFVNSKQPTVFPSIPQPVGAGNRDAGYTPLWRMVKVTWQPGYRVVELKSEEEILAAQDRAELSLTVTDVVLNCPVIGVRGDAYLRGASLVRDSSR